MSPLTRPVEEETKQGASMDKQMDSKDVEDDPVIEDVPSDNDDQILRAQLLEQQQWKAEQERWYGE